MYLSDGRRRSTTVAIAAAIATALLLALPAAVRAHATVSPDEIPASGSAQLELGVQHGCGGSPTTSVTVQLPPEITSARPQRVAGWDVGVAESDRITVTWEGGPLPDAQPQTFRMSVAVDGEAGQELALPVVQRCIDGVTPWTEVPVAGEPEPETPAPVLTLTAAADRGGEPRADRAGGQSADAENRDNGHEDAQAGDADSEAAEPAEDGDGGNTVAIVALIVAVVAICLAGLALAAARRRR